MEGPFVYPEHMTIKPTVMRRVHFGLVIFWLALWCVAALVGWLGSVTFVSHMSMAALVLASLSAWQGARAEHKADDSD